MTAPNGSMKAPMGWYPVESTLRWWDGTQWTRGYYADGRMRVNTFMVDQVVIAWIMGPLFLLLGVSNLLQAMVKSALHLHSGIDIYSGVLLIGAGIVWFVVAIRSTMIRRIPAPVSAPVVFDEARPLPGEVEGPGARWVTVGPKTARWWTGTRWTQYVGQRVGVRTTFTGVAEQRFMLILGLALLGAGVVIVGASAIVLGVAGGDLFDAFIIGGVLLVAGIVVVIMAQTVYRRTLLLPQRAPDA